MKLPIICMLITVMALIGTIYNQTTKPANIIVTDTIRIYLDEHNAILKSYVAALNYELFQFSPTVKISLEHFYNKQLKQADINLQVRQINETR